MELTTKAEPILGEFKGLRRLLWQLILALGNKEIAMRRALAEETSLLAMEVNAKLDGNPPEK
jgi:hypothetical protein